MNGKHESNRNWWTGTAQNKVDDARRIAAAARFDCAETHVETASTVATDSAMSRQRLSSQRQAKSAEEGAKSGQEVAQFRHPDARSGRSNMI